MKASRRTAGLIGLVFAAAAGATLLASCPSRSWRSSTLEAQDIDPARIALALDYIRTNDTGIHSLLIVRNGCLASESYFEGRDRDSMAELYSVTKSVISTLVGIALDQGKIEGVRVPLASLLDSGPQRNPDPRKAAITVEDALTMRAALDWSEGDRAYAAFYGSPDPVSLVLGQRMRGSPGEAFNYDSGLVHLLSALLTKSAGMDSAAFARRYLFGPLGIRRFEWERDRNGIPIGGWGLKLRPRDMAKLGLLMLRGGNWEGRQLVSKAWVEAATGTRVLDTGSPEGLGYGYLWWVHPALHGYAALGLGGQAILVVPGLDLVVVMTAATPDRGHGAIFKLIRDYIVPAVSAG